MLILERRTFQNARREAHGFGLMPKAGFQHVIDRRHGTTSLMKLEESFRKHTVVGWLGAGRFVVPGPWFSRLSRVSLVLSVRRRRVSATSPFEDPALRREFLAPKGRDLLHVFIDLSVTAVPRVICSWEGGV